VVKGVVCARDARARAALAAASLGEPVAHVDLVIGRIEALAGEDADGTRTLKLSALAHELPPEIAACELGRCGVGPTAARRVARLVESFWAADLWRGGPGAGPEAWLRRAGPDAPLLLLFEVAHEGGVTPAMVAGADMTDLGNTLIRRRNRLSRPSG
jgi:hypothetical protein